MFFVFQNRLVVNILSKKLFLFWCAQFNTTPCKQVQTKISKKFSKQLAQNAHCKTKDL